MSSRIVAPGTVSVKAIFTVRAAADGAFVPALAYDSPGLELHYYRAGAAAVVSVALADLATLNAAHTPGGFLEIDADAMPGSYLVHLPDAMFAEGDEFFEAVATLTGATIEPSTVSFSVGYVEADVQEVLDTLAETGAEGETLDAATIVAALIAWEDSNGMKFIDYLRYSLMRKVVDPTGSTLTVYEPDRTTVAYAMPVVITGGQILEVGGVTP
jgi:hypothetical protein